MAAPEMSERDCFAPSVDVRLGCPVATRFRSEMSASSPDSGAERAGGTRGGPTRGALIPRRAAPPAALRNRRKGLQPPREPILAAEERGPVFARLTAVAATPVAPSLNQS